MNDIESVRLTDNGMVVTLSDGRQVNPYALLADLPPTPDTFEDKNRRLQRILDSLDAQRARRRSYPCG